MPARELRKNIKTRYGFPPASTNMDMEKQLLIDLFTDLVLGSRSAGFRSATFFSQSKMSQSSLNWDILRLVQGWQHQILFPWRGSGTAVVVCASTSILLDLVVMGAKFHLSNANFNLKFLRFLVGGRLHDCLQWDWKRCAWHVWLEISISKATGLPSTVPRTYGSSTI